ncbi:MlaA family lipoprotein [Candidatus Nitrospira bockiana]
MKERLWSCVRASVLVVLVSVMAGCADHMALRTTVSGEEMSEARSPGASPIMPDGKSADAAGAVAFAGNAGPPSAGSPRGPLPGTQPSAAEAQEKAAEREAEPTSIESELYDPFQEPGEQPDAFEEYDPWEPFNVAMFNFNRKVDKYLVKPVAEVYDKVMPDGLERGISRGFHNIGFVPRFVNNLLQGKLKGAGIELTRFILNTTFGWAGMLDFSKDMLGLDTPDEDTGQTFGRYGSGPGPYLILPLLPQPFTIRDGVGYLFDLALNPMNYFLPFTTLFPMNVGYQLNERSINLETFQGVEEATVDLYGAVRNAYLQKRARAIRQ